MKCGNILVVEDNPDNMFTITSLLDHRGYVYDTAVDGESSLDAALKKIPLLVLMDIQLPGLSGVETARRMRADEKLKDVKIIALTAKNMKGDREKFLEAGFNDFLAKPINPEHLYALLDKWLQNC